LPLLPLLLLLLLLLVLLFVLLLAHACKPPEGEGQLLQKAIL
jgi:hypothetical protein